MGNYVTVATRPHPNWGHDPCPGDVEGSETFADQVEGFAERVEELAVFLLGTRNALDSGGWQGDSERAFHDAMVDFPPRLRGLGSAFAAVESAVRGWATDLADLQARSLVLDEALGEARLVEEGARSDRDEYLRSRDPVVGHDDPADAHAEEQLENAYLLASELTADAERALGDLEREYRDKAEHYGSLVNDVPGYGWASSPLGWADDLGDWVEDSWVGDAARWASPAAGWVSEWGGRASAGFTVLSGISLVAFPPALAFFGPAAVITGGASSMADGVLAAGGHGSWGSVMLGVVTAGIGGRVTGVAGKRIKDSYRDTGRSDQLVEVKTANGTTTYAPSLFTAHEIQDGELVWRAVELAGNEADWTVTGYSLLSGLPGDPEAEPVDVGFEAYESQDPWDLPPNIAYLEDDAGELVK